MKKEDSYVISGGKPLKGTIHLSGAKNVSLKAIIAALMCNEAVTLMNVPRINDVFELIDLVNNMGAHVEFIDKNVLLVDGRSMTSDKVDLLHASKIRVSFMLAAPLLFRFGHCFIPNPGGCRLGARSIDRIVDGVAALGVTVTYDSETGYYEMNAPHGITGGTYTFAKPSHTGTEVLLMIGAYAKNNVTIQNAALEPEIDELITFLTQAGAKITKDGSTIHVEGVKEFNPPSLFRVGSDRNEAITFTTLALATKGDITIEDVQMNQLSAFFDVLEKAGAPVEKISDTSFRAHYTQDLQAIDVETAPHPGFMTDWQPNWTILMTQAKGDCVIHERMFENRFAYISELQKLGAKIEYVDVTVDDPENFYQFNYDPQKKYQPAIKIYGEQKLHNGVLQIADLRAGAALVCAALIASGESVVNGVSVVERGYEDLVSKIQSVGGDIKSV